jgi:hypothetical protein
MKKVLGAREVDGRPPRGLAVRAEELRRVARQEIPVRAEVVVDDVETPQAEPCAASISAFSSSGRPYDASGANGSTPS